MITTKTTPQSPDGQGAAIRRALSDRIHDSAHVLATAAARLADDQCPTGGQAARVATLLPLIRTLTDAAAFADLHDGRTLDEITATLGLSHAEARRRYHRQCPPNLPLLAVLADDK